MKVFVTGATGFVGREIVRQLHEAGHAIRILARSRHSPPVRETIARWGAEVHPGDVLAPASLEGALSGMVGSDPSGGHHRRSRCEHIRARACGRYAEHPGPRPNQPAAAIHPHERAGHPVQRGLALSPDQVGGRGAGPAQRTGVHDLPAFVELRPADQFINLFARMTRRSPIVPLLGSPRARFQPVPVEAVAAAFVRSLREPRSVGQTYDLCGPEMLTLAAIVDQILSVRSGSGGSSRCRVGLHVARRPAWSLIFRRLLRRAPRSAATSSSCCRRTM